MHMVLTPSQLKSRLLIVGDVHGCLDELKELLLKTDYNPNSTTLLLLGDLVNKGPYSAEMVQYARSLNCLCIRGNHDDSALSFGFKTNEVQRPESYSYLDKLSRDDLEWWKECPYTITIPSFQTIAVHAGFVAGVKITDQKPIDMTTVRNIIPLKPENADSKFEGTYSDLDGIPWTSLWRSDYHIYFGHDAKKGLQMLDHCTGLDTGCCYGKKLSAILLPQRELIQVDAHATYCDPNS